MINNKNKSKVINFGCRLNSYEAEVIKSFIKKNNIENTIVFNSCAVTHEAERKVQQMIRKYRRSFPHMNIVVTGCAAQINPEKYINMEGVNSIIGNHEKMNNEAWSNINNFQNSNIKNIMNIQTINNNIVESFDGKARAYVEIQQGCNHRCTFCIIPFGRGNNRSAPIGLIVDRVKKLVLAGYNEVVLTGVDITDYGLDLPGQPSLSQMIRRLLKLVPELKQLRLSSIDCSEIDNDFWDLLEFEERLMPHLHISLQSGDDLILKRMKRRHSKKDVIEFCNKAKKLRPNITLGADLIAGFPTENDKMFNNTLKMVNDCDLVYLHVFPYSIRNGTPASKMPQVPNEIKKIRSKILRDLGQYKLSNYLCTLVGKTKKILIEKNIEKYSIGRTQEYANVKINNNYTEGQLVDLVLKSNDNKMLNA